MSDGQTSQPELALSPGALLKEAREAQELSQREVADRLHLMPGYPAIIERDEFHALRHPAFARGYVKAYGKLVGVDEKRLLDAFDHLQAAAKPEPKKIRTPPLQLQRTGVAVVVGLLLLALLVVAIWWWRVVPEANAQATGYSPVEKISVDQDRDFSMAGEI